MSNDVTSRMIEVERRCFNETFNPIHAWAAYGLARANHLPVPEWVLHYFDMAQRGILSISSASNRSKDAKDLGPRLLAAMGFAAKGKGSTFRKYHSRWLVYGMNVRHRMQLGDQEDHAITYVAKAENRSYSTVRRGWELYDRLFPGTAIFPHDNVE